MIVRATIAFACGLLVSTTGQAAALRLAPLFGDGAVLQRDVAHPIWGEAMAGAEVRVKFAGQNLVTHAAANGHWQVTSAPLTANAVGAELRVESAGETLVSRDVLVGEVWLCAGQSNMEWTLKNSPALRTVVARGRVPALRQFKVARAVADAPAARASGDWQSLSPATAANFSAVAYHFAESLQSRLDVPVGWVNSTWGATAIEAWMPAKAQAKFPAIAERWERSLIDFPERQAAYEPERTAWKEKVAAAKARGEKVGTDWPRPPEGRGSRREPGGLFNAMIAPLAPFPFRGVLWYQAEGNTGRAAEYAHFFPAMIEGWRAVWGGDAAWFFFVQLPNYDLPNDRSGTRWAELREAQAAALALPRTAMAVTLDAGVPDNGHPPDKTVVGQRLARLALRFTYGMDHGDAAGPRATAARLAAAEVTVQFESARSGLVARGGELTGFEIVDAAGTAHAATAQASGETVRVQVPAGVTPSSVRYAWRNNPPASLWNGAGQPAAPFRILVQSAAPASGGGQSPKPTSQ